jgi:DNA-binding NarL/FixJ family response regulator
MFPDKSILFEQITQLFYKTVPGSGNTKSLNLPDTERLSGFRERRILLQMEQRLDALENQNTQLLQLLQFILEQFPGLINQIMSDNVISKEKQDLKSPGEIDLPMPTRREVEVLTLLQKGFSAKEIAQKLFISETTVITHKKHLMDKFEARNTAELISKAGKNS